QENTEAPYRILSQQRRLLISRREAMIERCDEIKVLITRFDLLAQHYQSDLDRLYAIQEAGHLLDLEPNARCPLCGADPEHRQSDLTCEGNTSQIIEAATAQVATIKNRAANL